MNFKIGDKVMLIDPKYASIIIAANTPYTIRELNFESNPRDTTCKFEEALATYYLSYFKLYVEPPPPVQDNVFVEVMRGEKRLLEI